MNSTADTEALIQVWRDQSVWSRAANQLRRGIGRARQRALGFAIAGALLSAASTQVADRHAGATMALAFLSAAVLGLAPLLGQTPATSTVRDWTRTRAVSEALKAELYTYLAGVAPFRGEGRTRLLLDRTNQVIADAADLTRHIAGVRAADRPLPEVHDVESFIAVRIEGQINGYYRPRAADMRRRLARLRLATTVLTAIAAVLAALGGFLPAERVSAWVGVATTIGAAIAAHAAAERYEFQQVEFTRTVDQLEYLRSRYLVGPRSEATADTFVAECERVISIQNEGWMAKLGSGDSNE